MPAVPLRLTRRPSSLPFHARELPSCLTSTSPQKIPAEMCKKQHCDLRNELHLFVTLTIPVRSSRLPPCVWLSFPHTPRTACIPGPSQCSFVVSFRVFPLLPVPQGITRAMGCGTRLPPAPREEPRMRMSSQKNALRIGRFRLRDTDI